jgi:hypothetical protein
MGTGLTGLCLELALDQGACICVGGALACFGGLCSLLEHDFCLRCVEPFPLPKGSETCLLQVILFFAFLGFRSLVGVFFLFPFCFLFFLFIKCVCCQCTHQGGD